MNSLSIDMADDLQAAIQMLIFDIGQKKDHEVLHNSALDILMRTVELKKTLNKSSTANNTTSSQKRPSPENEQLSEINKVARKLPKWANKPSQINTRILTSFLELQKEGFKEITEDMLCTKYGNVPEFHRNFPQMKSIQPKNHAKVFDCHHGIVNIWEPVANHIKQFENTVLSET